jgi:putative addiction module component (TIGR02574 family)
MSESALDLLKSVLALPPVDRATLAEELLSSLDRPDPSIDERWAAEAEDRLAAFRAGQMQSMPADEVFAEFDRP